MRTITYHLFTALTAFAAGMGQTQIVRPGRLVGLRMGWTGIAGAGTFGGNASAMLNQNSVNDSLTNNPPRETFLASIYAWSAAAGAIWSPPCSSGFIPLNIPVRAGDLLTINAGNGGAAAPASSYLFCDFYVVEE